MRSVAIEGKTREELGSKNAKQLRREGMVPCVIYGGGENVHFYTDNRSFKELLYTPEALLVVISIDGKEIKSVVRDSQFHPVTEAIEHVDFFQLTEGEPFEVVAPINLVGNPRGVRNGGKMKFNLRRLTIRATEENLPGMIDLNVDELKIGDSLRVSDIPAVGFEILGDPSRSVVAINTSRNVVSEDGSEEGSEEAAAETAEA
ncbi:MAG: large subunit ribosomal protein L25 [Roseivirga sp.]|jgi:large subunit ribosomal protein L25